MRVRAILLLLCGGALAASPRGEFQKSSNSPVDATAVEAPAAAEGVAPAAEGADNGNREKRQWFRPGFNPNFGGHSGPGGFYPRQFWGNNYANYGPAGGFGGRTGARPGSGPFQMQQYMQQMQQFMNNLPPVINAGGQFRYNFPDVINTGPRSGVRTNNNNNFLPDVIDTGARGGGPFIPMPMLQYMYSNGFAPPMRTNQPAVFQRSWQQYFAQFTNRLPGASFDLRPQREINQDSADGLGAIRMDSSFGSPVEDTMTGSDSFSGSA